MMSADLATLAPEIAIALYAMAALVFAVYTRKDALAGSLLWVTAAVFVAVAVYLGFGRDTTTEAFGGLVVDDSFARFAKVIILLSAAAVLVMGQGYLAGRGLLRFEYPALIALAVVGMMVMVSAKNLMTLYMGLELQSLSLYVIASMRRDSLRSTEAGMKYFVLGALSSGLLLYGSSLVYGFAGTTQFDGIIAAAQGQAPIGLLFGLVFVASGLAFKVSAVPFHMWTPDVYEGSPAPVTAFFATAPKVAAVALFARVMHDAFGGIVGDWQQIVALLSLLSMFWGAIAAIGQTNIKRLLAYSSIAHMGFALMGLASGTEFGVSAMLIYMAIYVTMNVGTFAFVMLLERDGQLVTDISALHMYAMQAPGKALAVLALFCSLAGVPPFLGFFGKLYVLRAAYDGGLAWLAIAGVIASVIGAYYYLRIVYFMYFGKELDDPIPSGGTLVNQGLVTGCGIAMLGGVLVLYFVEIPALAAAMSLVQ
jgi:NADH-quinone oxidoreductase subunit N